MKWLVILALILAPVPAPRGRPIEPGYYRLHWDSTEYEALLSPDGGYQLLGIHANWYGSWETDAGGRRFVIHETCDGTNWHHWTFTLDVRREGTGTGSREVRIRLVRRNP